MCCAAIDERAVSGREKFDALADGVDGIGHWGDYEFDKERESWQ